MKLKYLILLLFVLAGNVELRSQIWHKNTTIPGASHGKLYKSNGQILYRTSGSDRIVYKSINNGTSWYEILSVSSTEVISLLVPTHDGGLIVGITENWEFELLKTLDDGQSWITQEMPGDIIVALSNGTLISTASNEFHISLDHGNSWQPKSYPTGWPEEVSAFVYPQPNDGFVLIERYIGEAYLADETGNFIEKLNASFDPWVIPFAVGVNGFNGNSMDHREKLLYNPVEKTLAANFSQSIFRWLQDEYKFEAIEDSIWIYKNFEFDDSGRIFSTRWDLEGNGQLVYSDDLTITWNIAHDIHYEQFDFLNNEFDISPASPWEYNISMVNEGRLFLEVNGILFVTDNLGSEFFMSDTGTSNPGIIDLFINDYSNRIYAQKNSGLIHFSDDQGISWPLIDAPGIFRSMAFDSNGGAFANTNDFGLFYSENGVDNWVDICPSDSCIGASFNFRTNEIWTSSYSENDPLPPALIYKLTSQGNTWSPIDSGTQGIKHIQQFYFNPIDSTEIYIKRYPELWIQLLNEVPLWIWGEKEMIITASGTRFVNRPWTSQESGLYRKEAGESEWQIIFNDDDIWAIDFIPPESVLLGTSQGIFFSLDNGDSWFSYNSGLPQSPNTADLIFDGDSKIFAAYSPYGLYETNEISPDVFHIKGKAVNNDEKDCEYYEDNVGLADWIVEFSNGFENIYDNTDDLGNFDFPYYVLNDSLVGELKLTPKNFLWEVCDSFSFDLQDAATQDSFYFNAYGLQDCPLLDVSVHASRFRPCFDLLNTALNVCNEGTVSADSVTIALYSEPGWILIDTLNYPFTRIDSTSVLVHVGTLDIGECVDIDFSGSMSCAALMDYTVCLTAHAYPDDLCSDGQLWEGAILEPEITCEGDSIVKIEIKNIGEGASSNNLEYIVIEDQIVLKIDETNPILPGGAVVEYYPVSGGTFRIEVEQEPGFPGGTNTAAWLEGCGPQTTTGMVTQFPLFDDNYYEDFLCAVVTNSYDPNAKLAEPAGIGPEHFIYPNTPIEYTLQFQNTGTDTAFTVVLKDTLSEHLDPNTLNIMLASHPFSWTLDSIGVLTFTFSTINLPDSTTNEVASHGFVKFKIDQQDDLPLGTIIYNSVGIYFDFNLPIITNQTFHQVNEDFLEIMVSAYAPGEENQFKIWPNPTEHSIHIDLSKISGMENNETALFSIYDISGTLLQTNQISANDNKINLNHFEQGLYFGKISYENEIIGLAKIVLIRK